MKPAFVLLVFLPSVAAAAQVKRVVVYPDRATVTRAVKIPCGSHVIAAFPGIPPAADPQSFRALASAATVDGVRWQQEQRSDAYAARATELQNRVDQIVADVEQNRRDQARFEGAKATARGYLELGQWFVKREMVGGRPATAVWKAAFDAAVDGELKAVAALSTARARLRELERELAEARLQLARLSSATPRREYRAEAVVSCPAGKTVEVELSYAVGGASWQPSYEARTQEAKKAVELKGFATITQNTGEDWRAARVILSTAVPRQNATPPIIDPLYVNSEDRPPPRKVLVEFAEEVRHSDGASGSVQNATGTRLRAMTQGLSVQLDVPDAADVPGDGTPTRLLFARSQLPAEFRFRTVPKLAPFVYLVADTTNSAPFPLLSGPIDMFRAGSFVARHQLGQVASGARFPLSFGTEERVRAKRLVLEEREHETGLVSKDRRRVYSYRFYMANYLDKPAELEISDHIPVSEMKDVSVTLDAATSAGHTLEKSDGIIRWPVKLAPGEQRSLDLTFHIDIPSEYR
jgi:uncharacterized protein (TIGR02231 family)